MAEPTVDDRSGDGAKIVVRKIKNDHYALTVLLPRPTRAPTDNVSIGATLRGLEQFRTALDNFIEQEARVALHGGRMR